MKLLMLGDSSVGKTSLILRYVDNYFTESSIGSLGEEYKEKALTVDDKKFKIQIFDTAGQERFRKVTSSYFRGGQGVMLCYDVTKRQTFDNIPKWMQEIQKYGDIGVAIVLVGNKTDLDPSTREVSIEEGEKMAKDFNTDYIEASAKTGAGVEEAFKKLAIKTKEVCSEESN
uniref:Uncharacterized protein n=1 Tax=Arcella intermedia TaxID=1963864 RepID=A0A6B2LMB9_9EUKA